MYLSKIKLNPEHQGVLYDVGNVHALHQRIMQGFLGDPNAQNLRQSAQILFVLNAQKFELLVQSGAKPDWSALPPRYAEDPKVKSVDLVSNIQDGATLRFWLRANPTIRKSQSRAIVPLLRQDEQLDWLRRKGEIHGFEVVDAIAQQRPTLLGFKQRPDDPDKKQRILINCVDFGGILRIIHAEKFADALQDGVGRSRPYGCGLLAIAPL